MSLSWSVRGGSIDLSRPRIMGVLNVTPDSFSDGGRYRDPVAARARVRELAAEGADLLDIGGESTRPGAKAVSAAEEIDRILPAVREAVTTGVPVSVDTSKAEVAAAALEAGAAVVNDVTALGDPAMAPLVAGAGAGLVLMHMKGTPRTMQDAPRYDDVVREVCDHLALRRRAARDAGIPRDRIVLDPGIGFGKTAAHNLELLTRLGALAALGSPVLVGVSRKRFLGSLTGESDPARRLPESLAAVLAARLGGAVLFRVHDVAAARRALAVFDAVVARRARDPLTPVP